MVTNNQYYPVVRVASPRAGRLPRKTEGLLGQVLIEKFSDLVESFFGFRRSGIEEVPRMRETLENL